MQCLECETIYVTRKPITRRYCPRCGVLRDFIEIKQPVVKRGVPFVIMCLKCQKIHRIQSIPRQCPSCGQHFESHAEGRTLTDVIYNAIIGSSNVKGYMRVDIARDGTVWWTVPRDSQDTDDDPYLGHRVSQSSYTGPGETMRDNLRPITTATTQKRNIRS